MHMQAIAHQNPFAKSIVATGATSRPAVWTGRTLSGFAVLFLLVDSVGKLLRLAPYVAGTAQLGYPTEILFALGLVEFLCVLVYLVPRTSLVGVVLLTGYLGGAVASHVR